MKGRIASQAVADSTLPAASRQSGATLPKVRSPRTGKAIPVDVQPSVIDFNRSRVTKGTAEETKPISASKAKRPPLQDVESQSERDVFARNFRISRKEAGLSQRDIQKLTGIAQSHLSEIESAMHNICIETMVKLAKLVKRPIHELLKP